MKKWFPIGLVALLALEAARVYFIMPMPGSQRMRSLELAYARKHGSLEPTEGEVVVVGIMVLISGEHRSGVHVRTRSAAERGFLDHRATGIPVPQERGDLVDGFTRQHRVHDLVWFELHDTMLLAMTREKAIKEWRRGWKTDLIEQTNSSWRDLYGEICG